MFLLYWGLPVITDYFLRTPERPGVYLCGYANHCLGTHVLDRTRHWDHWLFKPLLAPVLLELLLLSHTSSALNCTLACIDGEKEVTEPHFCASSVYCRVILHTKHWPGEGSVRTLGVRRSFTSLEQLWGVRFSFLDGVNLVGDVLFTLLMLLGDGSLVIC